MDIQSNLDIIFLEERLQNYPGVYDKLVELALYGEANKDQKLLEMFRMMKENVTVKSALLRQLTDEDYAEIMPYETNLQKIRNTLVKIFEIAKGQAEDADFVREEIVLPPYKSPFSVSTYSMPLLAAIETKPLRERVEITMSTLTQGFNALRNAEDPVEYMANEIREIFETGESYGKGLGTDRGDSMEEGEHTVTTVMSSYYTVAHILDHDIKQLELKNEPQDKQLISECKTLIRRHVNFVNKYLKEAASMGLKGIVTNEKFIEFFNKTLERSPEFEKMGVKLPSQN